VLKDRLPAFVERARDFNLEPLVEIHSADEIESTLATETELIGINNRDLATMTIDRSITRTLSGKARETGRLIVSESGMRSADEILLRRIPDRFIHYGARSTAEKTGGVCMRIKICGITRQEDAIVAEREGADAIGVVMFSKSPRSMSPEQAKAIFDSLGPFTATVAVTHTTFPSELAEILAIHPTAIQIFHPFVFADDQGVRVIRAIGRDDPMPDDCNAIIVDESHGKGKSFDLSRVRAVINTAGIPVLAGGLTPENVGDAVRQVHPYAVDVATGVEISPGIKDTEKIRAFIAACRST